PGATPRERIRSTSSRNAAFTRETSDSSRRLRRSRTESSRAVAVRTPTSAEKRISSNSASVASSSSFAAPTKALRRAMKPPRVFAAPPLHFRLRRGIGGGLRLGGCQRVARTFQLRPGALLAGDALRRRLHLGGRPRRLDALHGFRRRQLLRRLGSAASDGSPRE